MLLLLPQLLTLLLLLFAWTIHLLLLRALPRWLHFLISLLSGSPAQLAVAGRGVGGFVALDCFVFYSRVYSYYPVDCCVFPSQVRDRGGCSKCGWLDGGR